MTTALLEKEEREIDIRKYFMINLKIADPVESNPQPPDYQSDEHSTESLRPAFHVAVVTNDLKVISQKNLIKK